MVKACKTKIVLPSGDSFIINMNSALRMTEHFTIDELANWKNEDEIKYIITPESIVFLQRMEEFRRWYGKPITVNSNYRAESFNATLPAAINDSQHLKACAMDWAVKGHSFLTRTAIKNQVFKQARSYGCGCHVIYYDWGYHIDFAGTKQILLDYRN